MQVNRQTKQSLSQQPQEAFRLDELINLLYKNALYDKSKTTFAGMIKVEEGAHFTDAYQTCRNLLMSEECEANSLPGLEIKADQVKCSHGSTSNPVAEEELFYLMSRGIEEAVSRQLVTFGFVKDAVDRLENEKLEEVILKKTSDRPDFLSIRPSVWTYTNIYFLSIQQFD